MKNFEYYNKLIHFNNYEDVKDFLLDENGKVLNNYPNSTKNSKKKGFHRHHINEDTFPNVGHISNNDENKYKKFQNKDNLVYCDLMEHFILHFFILKDGNFKYHVCNKHKNTDAYSKRVWVLKKANHNDGLNAIIGKIKEFYIKKDTDKQFKNEKYKLREKETKSIISDALKSLEKTQQNDK